MPGIINSFDPATQTAVIQPALRRRVKGEAVSLPLLYDVPVFFPGSRVSGITWPVAAGDECLVVFADASIDEWFAGEDAPPASARQHDLSDAFAFVGFRSSPGALPAFSGDPSFFGIRPKSVQAEVADPEASGTAVSFIDSISQDGQGVIAPTKKSVRAMAGATADTAGTSGLVPAPAAGKQGKFLKGNGTWATPAVSEGGTGQTGTVATSTIADVATAETDCEITTAQYACWGKVAMVRLVVKKATAVSSGTTTLCTIVSGKRPRYNAMAQWAWNNGATITTAGKVQVNGAISAGVSITITSTYVLA